MGKINKKAKKRITWTKESELCFLELWEERLSQIIGKRRNSHIFSEMSAEIGKRGYPVSAEELQTKVHNFTKRFKKEKQIIVASGGSPSNWRHFAKVSRIIGHLPMHNCQHFVSDSIAGATAEIKCTNIKDAVKDTVVPEPTQGNLKTLEGYSFAKDEKFSHLIDEVFSDDSSFSNISVPETSTPCSTNDLSFMSSKKRKRTKSIETQFIDLEKERLQILKQTEDNADLHFFKSLLPCMATFNEIEKLEIRGEIQKLILEKLKNKTMKKLKFL